MDYPSERQQEILDLLQEECAEVIAIISKIRRFGLDCNWKGGDTNKVAFLKELQDVEILMREIRTPFSTFGDYGYNANEYHSEKIERLKKFTNAFNTQVSTPSE